MIKKIAVNLFFVFTCLSVTAALWVGKDFLFPFVTTKAFFFRILIELALPLYAYLLAADPKLRPNLKNPLNISILAFLVINIISSFFGVNVIRSLWGNFERMGGTFYLGHLVVLYFYVLALGKLNGKYLQWFLKFLLLVAFIETGNGIFGWLKWPTFVADPSLPVRVSSTLGNPIYLGSFLIVPMFIALFFSFQTEKLWAKISYWLLAFVFLFGIYLSGTRGAVVGIILGSFIAGLLYLVLTPSKNIRNYGLVMAAGFVVIAGVLFSYSSKLPAGSTLQRIFKLQDSNSEARLIQWKIALSGYKDRPILGTGPENYYVIANLYYNPEIFKYDASWFDKPHNYLIEILVTDGIFGLLAYLAMLGFAAFGLYKAYKEGLYGLPEFCILIGCLLVYQIQNLFVFDTVPASLMFYAFLGFGGYVWAASLEDNKKVKSALKPSLKSSQALAGAVFMVTLVVSAYAIYAANAVPLAIAKNVNYGYAYSGVDPVKADDYFNTAISLPFNFDKTETAGKFADFATSFVSSASPQNQALALKVLNDATSYMQQAIAAQPDNPILWQRMAALYLYQNVQSQSPVGAYSDAEAAANKAIALAPKREEGYLTLAQVYEIDGQLPEAEKILQQQIINFPTDKNARLQLANLLKVEGQTPQAAAIMESLISDGYTFPSYSQMTWLVQYYVGTKQFDKAIALQQAAEKVEPNNVQVYEDLAKLYAAAGQIQNARNLAQGIINGDATAAPDMQTFLNSLPKQ